MPQSAPRHIAIIPDGNRRWAKLHKKAALWHGHEAGAERFEEILRTAFDRGVAYATLWTASADNLIKRPTEEVDFLETLLVKELKRLYDSDDTMTHRTRVRVIGRGAEIRASKKLNEAIQNIEQKTKDFSKTHLTILFGYDGKEEMLGAIEQIAKGKEQIAEATLRKALATGFLPDVDLVIRTGGEPHWSAGFMMWLTANSQFYFTPKLWPEFDAKELNLALADYAGRERRLGK